MPDLMPGRYKSNSNRSNVVCQFSYQEDIGVTLIGAAWCASSHARRLDVRHHISHTTCALTKRSMQHEYNTSAICKHCMGDQPLHNVHNSYCDNFILLKQFTDVTKLPTAISIEQSSLITVKYNEIHNIIGLYKVRIS